MMPSPRVLRLFPRLSKALLPEVRFGTHLNRLMQIITRYVLRQYGTLRVFLFHSQLIRVV